MYTVIDPDFSYFSNNLVHYLDQRVFSSTRARLFFLRELRLRLFTLFLWLYRSNQFLINCLYIYICICIAKARQFPEKNISRANFLPFFKPYNFNYRIFHLNFVPIFMGMGIFSFQIKQYYIIVFFEREEFWI